MPFKNARIYSLNAASSQDIYDLLESKINSKEFQPCSTMSLFSLGWVSPLEDEKSLVRDVKNSTMICMRIDEKIMPASVIKKMVKEEVKNTETVQDRKVGPREKLAIRENIIHEMLPKAFIKETKVHAYIDFDNHIIVVDAASAKQSEQLLSLLRATLGSLHVQPFALDTRPTTFMTGWLAGSGTIPLTIGLRESCVLKDPMEGGGKISCTNIDLEGDEVKKHLDAGKQADRLELSFNESMTFKLESDLALKSIKFTDDAKERYGDEAEDPTARFDADFFMLSTEISRIKTELEACYGKVKLEQVAA